MAKISVNKIEAARRQINTAIRMLFQKEDPVSIHTLSMAALRILRDLSSQRDDSYINKLLRDILKPGVEGKFWGALHKAANFLKHADKDPDAILSDVEESVNDAAFLIACLYYQEMGNQLTPEMLALVCWVSALNPHFLREPSQSQFSALLRQSSRELEGKSRREQLEVGNAILELARKSGFGSD